MVSATSSIDATDLGHQQALGRDGPEPGDGLVGAAGVVVGEVVAHHVPALVLDPGEQLVELKASQAAVGAELHDVALDLLGDAADHLGPLQHRDHVTHRDQVLDLQRRERAGHAVQTVAVALQRLQAPGWPDRAGGPPSPGRAWCRHGRE